MDYGLAAIMAGRVRRRTGWVASGTMLVEIRSRAKGITPIPYMSDLSFRFHNISYAIIVTKYRPCQSGVAVS